MHHHLTTIDRSCGSTHATHPGPAMGRRRDEAAGMPSASLRLSVVSHSVTVTGSIVLTIDIRTIGALAGAAGPASARARAFETPSPRSRQVAHAAEPTLRLKESLYVGVGDAHHVQHRIEPRVVDRVIRLLLHDWLCVERDA